MRKINLQFLFLFVLGLLPQLGLSTPYEVKEIRVFNVNSAITPATFDYLDSHIKKIPVGSMALIKVNTPGGLITTTKDLITLIGSINIPVTVWITPEGASASSAGAIIASSAHFILMSAGTNLGAATPVGLGKDIDEKDGKAKALNDLMAMVRSLSHLRNRPAEPYEQMIESAKSFTNQEALQLKIIDGQLDNLSAIGAILSGKKFKIKNETFEIAFSENLQFKEIAPSLGQELLSVLANPSTAYVLFLVGLALLYFEFQAPGGYVAGGIGITLLILAAISFQVLPLNWGALALIIVGIILLILEIYITSYGLLGLGGLAAFIFGSLFLFHGDTGFISIEYPVLISTIVGGLLCGGFLTWYFIREKRKMVNHQDFFLPLGATGHIHEVLDKEGLIYQIKVRGEIWKAQADSKLEKNDTVKVTSIDKEKLMAKISKAHKE
jgi:membrane-bound serine protease (ClpP class)